MGFAGEIEITLEANPGTIERGRFAEYRAAGVTRVSLGAQSFDERQLKLLGRIHSADETRRAAEELHAAGLANFNLDLMYALPGQTAEQAQADLHAALALNPAHLSQYHLTIEPGTQFAAAPPVQPADEIVDDMLERCLRSLEDAGFEQYEVSGYARAGAKCTHNLNYWTFGDYLGIGAGAHGKLSFADRGFAVRTQQTREPRRYLAADPGALVRKQISQTELPFEFAMNGFRLVRGFPDEIFESRTGLADRRAGAGAGAVGGPRTGGTRRETLERDAQRLPVSQRHTRGIAAAGAGTAARPDIPCPADERFYAQMPRDGYVNNGHYGRFQSCCTINTP